MKYPFNEIPINLLDAMEKSLTPRERTVLKKRLFEKMTYEEIGIGFGVKRDRIMQVFNNGIFKLLYRYPKVDNYDNNGFIKEDNGDHVVVRFTYD